MTTYVSYIQIFTLYTSIDYRYRLICLVYGIFQSSKMWYRSSPAELYYKPAPDGVGVMQTSKLEKRCNTFFKELIERGRKARPEADELPPLRPSRGKACKHRSKFNLQKILTTSTY